MNERPYYEEGNHRTMLRGWVLGKMLTGAGWAALVVLIVLICFGLLRALAGVLPDNPNAMLTPAPVAGMIVQIEELDAPAGPRGDARGAFTASAARTTRMDSATPTLDRVAGPADLRHLSDADLGRVADELRSEVIATVSRTGGHLGSSLGVVELSVAIHAVFNTPMDKLVWDVGHQCYPHKILTGRRERMATLRQGGGLSGFTKRSESEYDPFGAAHSSTSISAALGFAVARDMGQPTGDAIAVIGDGAITAGMAYEAMNNAGHLKRRLFVILNDNDMSIAPPVGAMSSYLLGLHAFPPFAALKGIAEGFEAGLPGPMRDGARRARQLVTGMPGGGTLFEELGFSYIGPVDGHDMPSLLATLRAARARATGPVLIHAVTVKGKGYAPAETSADKYHGVGKFDIVSGTQAKAKSNAPSYTSVFGRSLTAEAARGPEDRRRHRRDARGHRAGPDGRAISGPRL